MRKQGTADDQIEALAGRIKDLEAVRAGNWTVREIDALQVRNEALAARVKELEAEVERELQGQVDISESGGRMYDKLSARIAELEDANLRAETEAQRLRELLESEQAEWEDALLTLNKENRDLEGRNRDLEAVVAPLLPLFRERFEEWEEQILFDPHDDITITAEFPVEALRSLAKEGE